MRSNYAEDQGMTLGRAALVAGLGLLIMVVAGPFAEMGVYAKLVVRDDIAATVQNLQANRGLFLAGIFSYFVIFVCDVVVAWALYVLLAPVNRSLSLLTAWFRIVYTVIAFVAMFKLVTVFHMLDLPDYNQMQLLLDAFRHEWNTSLILFGVHLLLLAYLVYRADYIPGIFAILLAIAGAGWLVTEFGPYLLPDADLGFLYIAYTGEIIFMLWLLIRGWKIQEPTG